VVQPDTQKLQTRKSLIRENQIIRFSITLEQGSDNQTN